MGGPAGTPVNRSAESVVRNSRVVVTKISKAVVTKSNSSIMHVRSSTRNRFTPLEYLDVPTGENQIEECNCRVCQGQDVVIENISDRGRKNYKQNCNCNSKTTCVDINGNKFTIIE